MPCPVAPHVRSEEPAGVIAEWLGVQPSSPSFHLAQLFHADLIIQRCLSRQLIYSVSGSGVSMTALGHERRLRRCPHHVRLLARIRPSPGVSRTTASCQFWTRAVCSSQLRPLKERSE